MFFFFNATAPTEIYTLSYTTLFRSYGAGRGRGRDPAAGRRRGDPVRPWPYRIPIGRLLVDADVVDEHPLWEDRSEEHTSELQSRRDLVCRLLLEKKKKIKK